MAFCISRKICSSCKQNLPTSFFSKNKQYADGFRGQCKKCRSEYSAKYVSSHEQKKPKYNPERNRAVRLKKKYGITQDEYLILLRLQEFKCGICRKDHSKEKHSKLHVDHCHETGLVRGLLCSNCNTSIGRLGDNIEGIAKALNYLVDGPDCVFKVLSESRKLKLPTSVTDIFKAELA